MVIVPEEKLECNTLTHKIILKNVIPKLSHKRSMLNFLVSPNFKNLDHCKIKLRCFSKETF